MKVLILTCNTGGGHNSAARAVKSSLVNRGVEVEVRDAIAYISKGTSKLVSKGHIVLYQKFPKLIAKGYEFEENHPPKDGKPSNLYDIFSLGAQKLYKELLSGRYQAVICTHVFGALTITAIKKKYAYPIKSYFIATDYSCSLGVSDTDMDGYFIPHKDLIEEFVENGVPEVKIIPSGIPVRLDFYKKRLKIEAKKELYLRPDKRIVLLMGGSMGAGPIKDMAMKLSEELPQDCMLVAICASNDKLRNELHKSGCQNIRIIGYTSKMDVFMDAADLIITKPGGLTTTEIAVKQVPAIFVNAVMGCETSNMQFFEKKGYSYGTDDINELVKIANRLLSEPESVKSIKEALNKTFPKYAPETISDYVLKDCKR